MAGFGAATAVLLGAFFALNEEEVAHDVGAVDVGVAGLAALMAAGDDLVADALAQAFVKDKVFAAKLIWQPLLPGVVGILDDAAFQLIDLVKAFVLEVGRGFFAAYAAGAVHHDVLVAVRLEDFLDDGQRVPEGVHVGGDGSLKMPHLALVVVAHVHDDGVLAVGQFVEFLCLEVNARVAGVKSLVVQAIGHDFGAHLEREFEEGLSPRLPRRC